MSSTPREPWKESSRPSVELPGVLPSLAKQAATIGAWVPKPQQGNKDRHREQDALPQIEEIANRIADRYACGLEKLNKVQQEWRHKHDALVRRKLQQSQDDLATLSREEKKPSYQSGSQTARGPFLGEEDRPRHHRSALSQRNGQSTPRRGPKKKRVRTEEMNDVQMEEPDNSPEQSITEMLKSGFGDLLHAKRGNAEPEGEESYSRGLGVGSGGFSGQKPADSVPSPISLPASAEEVLEDPQADPGEILGKEADLAVAAAVDSAMVTATAGETQPAESDNRQASKASALSEDPERQSSKRSVPYRPEAVARHTRAPSHKRTGTWSRPLAVDEAGDDDRHGKELSFATCSELAKKHRLTVVQVRQALEEFLSLDKNGDGRLSFDEFEQAIRDRCEIPVGTPVPQHLLNMNWNKADADGNAEVNFEEFLLWSTEHAFTEELVVHDPKERYLRELARKHNFTLDEVERCHKTFNACDSNKNGCIEEVEFRHCVAILWKCELEDISATRLRQFWLEADKARSGKLGFEVFLVWYVTIGAQ